NRNYNKKNQKTKNAATINQLRPIYNPYSLAASFSTVKEGFTLFVESNKVGNKEAIVVAKLPKINKEENKNPVLSFLNLLIRNKPIRPIAPIIGNIQSQ